MSEWIPRVGDRIRITNAFGGSKCVDSVGNFLVITRLVEVPTFDEKGNPTKSLEGFDCGDVYFNIDNKINDMVKYETIQKYRIRTLNEILK